MTTIDTVGSAVTQRSWKQDDSYITLLANCELEGSTDGPKSLVLKLNIVTLYNRAFMVPRHESR